MDLAKCYESHRIRNTAQTRIIKMLGTVPFSWISNFFYNTVFYNNNDFFYNGLSFIMDFFYNIFFILTTDKKSAEIEISLNICWFR